jgi:hypothetical protein
MEIVKCMYVLKSDDGKKTRIKTGDIYGENIKKT